MSIVTQGFGGTGLATVGYGVRFVKAVIINFVKFFNRTRSDVKLIKRSSGNK